MPKDKTAIKFEQNIPEEILSTVKAEAENKHQKTINELEEFVAETSKLHVTQSGKTS